MVFIYGAVAAVQHWYNPTFMSFVLNETRVALGTGRGVISLTTEPSFYGSMCIFLGIFSLLSYSRKQNLIVIPLLLFQMVFFAKSATAISIVAFSIVLYTIIQLLRFRVGYIVTVSVLLFITVPVFMNQLNELEDTRVGLLAKLFIEDPLLITQLDSSVAVRFAGAVSPFLSFKHNYMFPMGIGNYGDFIKRLYRSGKYRNFLNPYTINNEDRLGGSTNVILFQLGFLGLLFPIAITMSFWKRLDSDGVLFAFIIFMATLFTLIQLMHSMIGFIIGYALYTSRNKANSIST